METTRDRGREAVRGALGVIAGALGLEIPQAVEQVWLNLFDGEDADQLKDAVCLVLNDWGRDPYERWRIPPVSIVQDALERVKAKTANLAAEDVRCDRCGQTGLVESTKSYNGDLLSVMVPCSCPIGQNKRRYLGGET